jgi:hypothetical protein
VVVYGLLDDVGLLGDIGPPVFTLEPGLLFVLGGGVLAYGWLDFIGG